MRGDIGARGARGARLDRGTAVVEYAGLVAVIGCLFAGLVLVHPVQAGRRAPVRPIPAIIRLIQAPARPVVRVPARRPRRSGARRPAPRRAGATVLLPTWLGGAPP